MWNFFTNKKQSQKPSTVDATNRLVIDVESSLLPYRVLSYWETQRSKLSAELKKKASSDPYWDRTKELEFQEEFEDDWDEYDGYWRDIVGEEIELSEDVCEEIIRRKMSFVYFRDADKQKPKRGYKFELVCNGISAFVLAHPTVSDSAQDFYLWQIAKGSDEGVEKSWMEFGKNNNVDWFSEEVRGDSLLSSRGMARFLAHVFNKSYFDFDGKEVSECFG